MTLSGTDLQILDFERSWWQQPGPKGSAIQRELAMSPTAYYRRLNTLIDDPAVAAADPLLVKRLRRARADRRRTRYVGPHWKRSRP